MAEQFTAGDHLRWRLTGATALDGYQNDPAASIGTYRSMVEFQPWAVRRHNPIPNIEILGAASAAGVGAITAIDADTLAFTAPGDAQGASVAIADGETRILVSDTADYWVRVRRLSTADMDGEETITITELVGNLWDDVASAEAVAGDVEYRCLSITNGGAESIASMVVWLGDCDDTFAVIGEAPSSDAATTIADEGTDPGSGGWTWNTGTTSGTGESIPTITTGSQYYLWVRRTIAADRAPAYLARWALNYQYDVDGTTYTGALSGAYRVARADYAGWGIWAGEDAEPDLEAAPDETYASLPHTTTLTLAAGHIWYIRERQRNQYGVWSARSALTRIPVDSGGDQYDVPPSGPQEARLVADADGSALFTAQYWPAPDGDYRGHLWLVWEGTAAPDPDVDTPDAYEWMESRFRRGVEPLRYQLSATGIPGELLYCIARIRRIVSYPDSAFNSDVTQLPASGAGALFSTALLSADYWSGGYAEIMTATGLRREIVQYTFSAPLGHNLAVAAGGRGMLGTTAQAGEATDYVRAITFVDSINTTVSSVEAETAAPSQPTGDLFVGRSHAVQQVMGAPTMGVVTIHDGGAEPDLYWSIAPGDISLYMGTVLAWRAVYDLEDASNAVLYIPHEWNLSATDAVTGTPTGTEYDGIEVPSWTAGSKIIYFTINGARAMKLDSTLLTWDCAGFTMPSADIPDIYAQEWLHVRFAQLTMQLYSNVIQNYFNYAMLDADSIFHARMAVNKFYTQAEIEAL